MDIRFVGNKQFLTNRIDKDLISIPKTKRLQKITKIYQFLVILSLEYKYS